MIDLLQRRREMMGASVAPDDGLFAYWDESDAPTSNKTWTDKISGLNLTLSTSAIYSNGEYKILNGQKMIMKDSLDAYLEYEIMAEIGYDAQLNDTSRDYFKILDFGAFGTCKWDYGFMVGHKTSGDVYLNAKNKTNQSFATSTGNYTSYSKGDWLYNQIAKAGIRVTSTDYQQLWAMIGNAESYTTDNLTKVVLRPLPINGLGSLNTSGYFSLGSNGSAAVINQNFVVHYVKLYSKSI